MKFGKTLQAQQIPGWGDAYQNYKGLKKIINSLVAGRPASEASLLALGIRPAHHQDATRPDPQLAEDLEPLPPETLPPGLGGGMNELMRGSSSDMALGMRGRDSERDESFKAHRAVFFWMLGRELEKINAFYLVKERDLRLRLLTLLTNRKRLLHRSRTGGAADVDTDMVEGDSRSSRKGLEWESLEEGWRLFERDLGKLQQYIEINATAFRKILKKWDKRSKSNTKELYLERQVEVQPCFNREFIAKLSDVVAANLLDLENGSEHLSTSFLASDLPDSFGVDGLTFDRRVDFDADASQTMAIDAFADLESNMSKALSSGQRDAVVEWLKQAKSRQRREKDQTRITRIIWRAMLEVSDEFVDLVASSVTLDFAFIDDINGRGPLHEACIAGSLRVVKLCVERSDEDAAGKALELQDAYDRRPLHYAAIHGHAEICSYLLSKAADASTTDMDGYTPLMHAIISGNVDCVRIFAESAGTTRDGKGSISLEPTAISNDLIPLSLACQYGHEEVARLLLRRGAKVIPNSEGMYPQHLACKAGHERICRLLVEEGGADGGGKDRADKYNLWTPLHHAAIGNGPTHFACVKILVEAGCDVNVPDEYGKTPGWYAAWFGHVECLKYLLNAGAKLGATKPAAQGLKGPMANLGIGAFGSADSQDPSALSPNSDLDLDGPEGEFEMIPSLSLPPPIIPLRVYGHEFLAKRCLVQLSLGHPFSRRTQHAVVPPIKLYGRAGQDHPLQMWSSLKLVMTSKSDTTSIPHSVILPLADEREVFSFQVDRLERFTLELSLYPTFGSKIIGRAIVLPSTFADVRNHHAFMAPLLDHHLKAIGEVAFEVSCIRPFEGAQLEIGGKVQTYWKSTVAPTTTGQDHAHQHQLHRPLSVSTSSPSLRSPVVDHAASTSHPAPASKESGLVTASSLSGEYVNLTVQVTRDAVPVVCPDDFLPVDGLDIAVSDVSLAQFEGISTNKRRRISDVRAEAGEVSKSTDWHTLTEKCLASLETVLTALPVTLGVCIELRYSPEGQRPSEINDFVDAVLHTLYNAGKSNSGRKVMFASFDPTVCTALNWKQPNYAVFFSSYCGVAKCPDGEDLVPASAAEQADIRCLSVREAVNFARSNNLLGVILEASILASVPSLVQSVKDAGLILATFGRPRDVAILRAGTADGPTIDAYAIDGIITLSI